MAHILLVDDEPDVKKLFNLGLTMAGHTVTDASSGEEALTAYELCKAEDPIDLVVTDIGMPFINGYEVAEKLKGLTPGLPIVFLSAFDEDYCEEHEGRIEPVAHLTKPVTVDELRAVVERVTEKRGATV